MIKAVSSLKSGEIFGFIRPSLDTHTLGINYVTKLLNEAGYKTVVGGRLVTDCFNELEIFGRLSILIDWIKSNRISRLGVSYRLGPQEAQVLFGRLYHHLRERGLINGSNPVLRGIYFAGLPAACSLIETEYEGKIPIFKGDESPSETLLKLGVTPEKIPQSLLKQSEYDEARFDFGKELIGRDKYSFLKPLERSGYYGYGTSYDHLINRLDHFKGNCSLPLTRVHVGPYHSNSKFALDKFINWIKELIQDGNLDIVSIGTSQLTQARFGEDWNGAPNGGGVPINSEEEYASIWQASRPMLVRTYAGTNNILKLAEIHERSLNIAWHALSFWWFCKIDGRGPNEVYQNLTQHFKVLDFVARTGKPFEANVPHHFSFRGGDDITYIISAVLSARAAKLRGVKYFVLQNMLNTPKYTAGIQDLAKARVMLKLTRELEDENFRIIYQPRAGLDYFSPDLDKAKIQLAAVTALIDDVEPNQIQSPEIIHVVSYSEAAHLADPKIINESLKIVRQSLIDYRQLRSKNGSPLEMVKNDVELRVNKLELDVRYILNAIEAVEPNPYSPEGFYKIFASGFLVTPYLWECRDEFAHAVKWNTDIVDGGVSVVDEKGCEISAQERASNAMNYYRFIKI